MTTETKPDNGCSVAVRTLMAAHRMDRDPAPLVLERVIRLYAVGPLLYAWNEAASKLWDWLPSGTFWHEMTAQRHRTVIHRDTLQRVVAECLSRGATVVILDGLKVQDDRPEPEEAEEDLPRW